MMFGQTTCEDDSLLHYDQACLKIFSKATQMVHLYSQVSECYQCDLQFMANVPPGETSYVFSTVYPTTISMEADGIHYWNEVFHFGQGGVYGLNVTDVVCSTIYDIQASSDAEEPLWIEFWILASMGIIWWLVSSIINSQWFQQAYRSRNTFAELESDLGSPSSPEPAPLVQSEFVPNSNRFRSRVKSLDTFRGIAIALMLFVNYGGGGYWFFRHAPWNGLTVADLIFPWFAWIMGMSLVMSIRSQLRARHPRRSIYIKSLHRFLSLLTLGLILNSSYTNNVVKLRFPGVLQRLGVAYFIVIVSEAAFMKPQITFTEWGRLTIFQDILSAWKQWILMILLGVTHFSITMYLPVPNCPSGYLGPGGLHMGGVYDNCTGGAAGYIDRLLLTNHHLYKHPTPRRIYKTHLPYDPEGILGSLNTALIIFLGAQAGRILLTYNYAGGRVKRWLIWALITGLAGGCLCGWSKEGGLIPINKNLWSLSFVLVSASLAFTLMTILFLLVDHGQWWSGTPFLETGKNAILLYTLSELMKNMLPWRWAPLFGLTTHAEPLIMDTWGTVLWILIAFILNKNDFFFTL